MYLGVTTTIGVSGSSQSDVGVLGALGTAAFEEFGLGMVTSAGWGSSTSSSAAMFINLYRRVTPAGSADFDESGTVDQHDITFLQDAFGSSSATFDLNDDLEVNDDDLTSLLQDLGTVRGDLDLDADVDANDFAVLGANMNTAGVWSLGDLNRSGTVTLADYSLLAANYGYDNNGFSRSSVPEPAVLVDLMIACLFAARRHR
jgi:hypothetical protein